MSLTEQHKKERDTMGQQLSELKAQQDALKKQKEAIEQEKDEERKQMQRLFVKVAQQKKWNDQQNNLLQKISEEDKKWEEN